MLIVTNADAIKDAVTGTAQVVGKNKKHTIKAVAAVDPKTGLVLLSALPSDVTPLSLGDSDTIDIAIPSPKKIKYHYKILGHIQASVSEARELREDKRVFANDRRSFRNGIRRHFTLAYGLVPIN